MMKQKSCSSMIKSFTDRSDFPHARFLTPGSIAGANRRSRKEVRGKKSLAASVSASAFAWLALGLCCPLRHCLHTCGVKAAMGHATVTTGL